MIPALIIAAVLGACAGSFLGVVIHRLPRGLSIVTPPSRCGACGTRLSWFENLPVLGWLLLRGRCRHCGTPIPASCIVLELSVAALTTAVVWAAMVFPWLWSPALLGADQPWWALGAAIVALLTLGWICFAAVVIDWELLIIPDELTKGLQIVAVPLAAACSTNLIWPWAPHAWLRHHDALDGWQGTPGTAAWTSGLVVAGGCALIAASMPLARWIYNRYGGEGWSDAEHRAMRAGGWWFIATTLVWTAAALAVILGAGPASLAAQTDPWHLLALSLVQALLGALTGWWLPWSVALAGTVGFRRSAMGYGDVKLFCAVGAFLGPLGTLAAFMAAVMVGALTGIPARLLGSGREMPFGPSLVIGAAIAIASGPWLAPHVAQFLAALPGQN